MRRSRTISLSAAAVEFVPPDYFAVLNLRAIFSREAPLEVDIGCGDGAYLAALAGRYPQHNFLGIERLAGRVRAACNKIAQQQIENARVLRVEAAYAVTHLLPPRSVTAFHILFPDPWPKRRHQRRRVLDENFFRSLERALVPGGNIRLATDQRDYFDRMREAAAEVFQMETSFDGLIGSTFQRRYEEAGAPIYRVLLRKTSDVR